MKNLVIYRDRKKELRWRLKTRNGRIVAEGGEGYKREAGLKRGLAAVQKFFQTYEP
jgi:uncharacterized protein YegP (UPF0339 family)